jgi:hypothetical protein
MGYADHYFMPDDDCSCIDGGLSFATHEWSFSAIGTFSFLLEWRASQLGTSSHHEQKEKIATLTPLASF